MAILIFPAKDGWFGIKDLDHSGIHSKSLTSGWQGSANRIEFKVRIDAQMVNSIRYILFTNHRE